MPLTPLQKELLLAKMVYRTGPINSIPLLALFESIEAYKGPYGISSSPNVRDKTIAAATSTPTSIVAGPCRLYGVLIAPSGTSANDDLIVKLTDNDVVIASTKVKQKKPGAAIFWDADNGVGIACATDLELVVTKADGTTNPDAADRSDVTVLFGTV